MGCRQLDEEALNCLWKSYRKKKDKKKKQTLVEHYFPFVQKIAYRLAKKINWQVEPDALSSFGVDGLYRAIDGYRPSRGVRFESYANRRIRGAMIDGLRREDMVPRSVRILGERFERHKQKIQNHLGRKVSDVEASDLLGMDESYFQRNYRKFLPSAFSSLETGLETDQEEFKEDCNIVLKDESDPPGNPAVRKEFFNKLMGDGFSPIERRIVWLYYYEGLTMDRVSKRIKLSESRVSQMHKAMLPRLADKIKRNPEYFGDIHSFIGYSGKAGAIR